MDDSMIHESVGAKIAIVTIKDSCYFLGYYFFFPVYDFIVLQVQEYTFLNPATKAILSDTKFILGVLIALFILIKVISGIVKNVKEIKALDKDSKKNK